MPKLEDIFSSSDIPKSPSCNIGRIVKSSSHRIYPLCHLNELLELIKTTDDEPLLVRYLVDTGGAIWFAAEGRPNSSTIPEHYKMTGEVSSSARCLAAGNITFSPDGKKITSINHKSGDFHPPFSSLKFPLTILVAKQDVLSSQSITLADDLQIEKLTLSGGGEGVLTVKKSELERQVLRTQDLTKLPPQPTSIKCVTYESLHKDDDSDDESAPKLPSRPAALFGFRLALSTGADECAARAIAAAAGASSAAAGMGAFDESSVGSRRARVDEDTLTDEHRGFSALPMCFFKNTKGSPSSSVSYKKARDTEELSRKGCLNTTISHSDTHDSPLADKAVSFP